MKRSLPIALGITLISFYLSAFKPLSLRIPEVANARWLMLGVMLIFVLLLPVVNALEKIGPLLAAAAAFAGYSMLTMEWSQNARLTLATSVPFMADILVMLGGGLLVGQYARQRGPFAELAPVWMLGVFSSIVCLALNDPMSFQDGYLRGYLGNPNMLGSSVAFSSPWAVWKLHDAVAKRRRILLWALNAGAGIVILLMSHSRAAILLAACIAAASVYGTKHASLVNCTIALAVLALLMGSHAQNVIQEVRNYIYKTDVEGHNANLFASRTGTWGESYEKAKVGGFFGVGYAIHEGISDEWSGELTRTGFGREKSASPLAVAEELGLVGLALYLFVQIGAYAVFARKANHRQPPGQDEAFLRRLMKAYVVGAFLHSCAEAWFTAPGATETAMYWTTLGLGFGYLLRRSAGVRMRAGGQPMLSRESERTVAVC